MPLSRRKTPAQPVAEGSSIASVKQGKTLYISAHGDSTRILFTLPETRSTKIGGQDVEVFNWACVI